MKSFAADRPKLPLKSLTAPPVSDNAIARLNPGTGAPKEPEHKHGGIPQVETIKQGDKVVRLVVTCSCGERIEIDCLYPAGG